MSGDEGGDIGLEFRRGSVDAALQLLARQLGEPAFDLVDPGRRSWREVHMPMRAAGKPSLDLRRLVGGIIVHREVDVRPLGHLGIDPPEEVEELGRPMALVAFSDHGAGGDIEHGEQGCRAITNISVRTSLGRTRNSSTRVIPSKSSSKRKCASGP